MDYYYTIIILCSCFLALIITYVYLSLSRDYKIKTTEISQKKVSKKHEVVTKEKVKKEINNKKSNDNKIDTVTVKNINNSSYRAKKIQI